MALKDSAMPGVFVDDELCAGMRRAMSALFTVGTMMSLSPLAIRTGILMPPRSRGVCRPQDLVAFAESLGLEEDRVGCAPRARPARIFGLLRQAELLVQRPVEERSR